MRAAFAVFRLHRWRHWPVLTLALGLSAACAHPVQGPLAGSSDAWNKASEPEQPAVAPAPAWDAYATIKHWPPANAEPFSSLGHQPEQQVDVRVSPEIRAIYADLVVDSAFPDGSLLSELPHAGDGYGYAMRKMSGRWQFFELDARGGVLSSGALSLCADCHAQAPADGVFGLPRAPRQPR